MTKQIFPFFFCFIRELNVDGWAEREGKTKGFVIFKGGGAGFSIPRMGSIPNLPGSRFFLITEANFRRCPVQYESAQTSDPATRGYPERIPSFGNDAARCPGVLRN
jgi:hypothetical protein